MRETKAKMTKAAEIMMKKANDCLDLAKVESDSAIAQHENATRLRTGADLQDASAKKLAQLGHELERDAINLQGEALLN
jgi:hypothetical protein